MSNNIRGSKYYIIDRRENPKGKSDTNRHRFLKRYQAAVKQAVKGAIGGRSIKEAVDQGVSISIPKKNLKEYEFQLDYATGMRAGVNVGNTKYSKGDLVLKPPQKGGKGNGRSSSNSDETGEDSFTFTISAEEFEQQFFSDLELPNLVNKTLKNVEEYKKVRTGFSTVGNPCNLDLVRSMRKSLGREITMGDNEERDNLIYKYQKEYDALLALTVRTDEQQTRIGFLREEIKKLLNEEQQENHVSIDKMDLQYRTHSLIPVPNTQAVMFCIMDVSGSMGEYEKDLAKRFFILLYLFLRREYEKVEIRFLRHHTVASEVEEYEFFNDRETGGTLVSPVMHKMKEIIESDYNDGSWNIYAAQASDGDNFSSDTSGLRAIMCDYVLRKLQYFAYIEVTNPAYGKNRGISEIMDLYNHIKADFENMTISAVQEAKDIFSVFKKLFKKSK